MVADERVSPRAPASAARSTVRLRKLGHGPTVPHSPMVRKLDYQRRPTPADSPITFPTDSPVQSERPSRAAGISTARKKYVPSRRGESGQERLESTSIIGNEDAARAGKVQSSETRGLPERHASCQHEEIGLERFGSNELFKKENTAGAGEARNSDACGVMEKHASSRHGERRRKGRLGSTSLLGEENTTKPGKTRDNDARGSGSDLAVPESKGEDLLSRAAIHAAVEDWLDYEGSMLEDSLQTSAAKRPIGSLSGAGEAKQISIKRWAGGSDVPSSPPLSPGNRNHESLSIESLDRPCIPRSLAKRKPALTPRPVAASGKGDGLSARQTRKNFEAAKRDTAAAFLKELDDTITGGRLAELAASTGGVKLNWNNKLNPTAGRANWKRETVRGRTADQTEAQHRHHASIDISEKVIDNEHRLLNVIAHEFCHLANFMISGVTGNPHGKEFKAWASKCSKAFSERGIEVTTKHSYDIDFKYVWHCSDCKLEYKRHSKSIDPGRHRCGACTGTLLQIKPTPRAGGSGKASEYQTFVREQMRVVRAENPKVPQKEIMRLVAEKWAASSRKKEGSKATEAEPTTGAALRDVTDQLNALGLGSGVRDL